MQSSRLEAFSDGVLAIIITIMVLEIKVPHGATFEALTELIPVFISYVLSFGMILIYWNNHHHLFQSVEKVNGAVLLANGHLLFWLSLSPFVTGWMGENHFAPQPVFLYGFVALMSGGAYYILTRVLVKLHGETSVLAVAVGKDKKAFVSLLLYSIAMACALFYQTGCKSCFID
jgi:uncharacterized membrane protein